MCDCIEKTEQRYKEHLKENNKTFKEIEDFEVGFVNKAFLMSSCKTEIVLPIEASWEHRAKSGRVSTKRKTSNFTINYCPFCGEKKGD